MKIAVFTDTFYPQINGVVTHLFDTLSILGQKHTIIVFAPAPARHARSGYALDTVETVFLPSIPTFIYQDLRFTSPFYPSVLRSIVNFNPDIIHVHSPSTVGINGLIVAKRYHIPIVGTFHGYIMEPEYLRIVGFGLDKLPFITKVLWKASNAFYNRLDTVIAPSGAVKRDLEDHGAVKPIEVISNGINLSKFKALPSNNLFDLPKKYFLYVGRVSREKNLDILLKAYTQFHGHNNEVHLVIVGNGPIMEELKQMTQNFSIHDFVHFLGEVARDQLIHSNILYDALAFVTASTSETQGISILEAMAAGLPIIGVNAKAIPDLIKENGILCKANDIFSFADALTSLAADPAKVTSFRRASLEAVKKHSIDHSIEKLESLYQTLCKTE